MSAADKIGEISSIEALSLETGLNKQEELRRETTNKTLHNVLIWALIFATCVISVIVLVRVYHLIICESFHWLSKEEVKVLDNIITGAITGFALNIIANKVTPNLN